MPDCSENRNPLIRSGTSQQQRSLASLDPSSVEILDKQIEDWMVWAGQFSDHISFTLLNNSAVGSMKPFFTNNISAQLALAASFDSDQVSLYIREQLLLIEKADTGLKEPYTFLFDIILFYFSTVDELLRQTSVDTEFHGILENHLKAKMVPLTERTLAYYKASKIGTPAQKLIIDSTGADVEIFFNTVAPHQQTIEFRMPGLSAFWYDGHTDFLSFYTGIAEDDTIFGGGLSVKAKIKYAGQHNFFTGILDEISASVSFVTALSEKYLDKYINGWPNHQPNYALFLTWLHLLEHSKSHLNQLTGRHLEFYYRKVLQLVPQKQSSDLAYLILTLNKTTSYYAIKENTTFIGPKDKDGELIQYRSIKETVLNKASIKYLSSIYYGDEDDNLGAVINKRRLFSAPVINSGDGLGEKLPDDTTGWHPFHIKSFENGNLSSINMPRATIGFAVASHYLRLREGVRKIKIVFHVSNTVVFNNFDFSAYITTEKEWLLIEDATLELKKAKGTLVKRLVFSFELSADLDPVVSYEQNVHGGSLNTNEPVIKIILEHKDSSAFKYDRLSQARIKKIDIDVEVGDLEGTYNENGIKNLEIHNDLSPLNPAKPFFPWGVEPKIGNGFIIGNDELFYKKGAKIQLNFFWKDYPLNAAGDINLGVIDYDVTGSPNYVPFYSANGPCVPLVEVQVLKNNTWNTIDAEMPVFHEGLIYNVLEKIVMKLDLSGSADDAIFLEKDQTWNGYNASSSRGYLRLKLNHDFGHRDYYQALKEYAKTEGATAPAYPYNPTLQALTLSYEAKTTEKLDDSDTSSIDKRDIAFFHIGPFGDEKKHKIIQGKLPTLVSDFVSRVDNKYKAQGSLFIGFENLQPGDTQSVLFQLQEGSEDPLLEKPADHLKWQYLDQKNVWHSLTSDEVGDNTNGLIQSGLIHFTIPTDASLHHTAFEDQLIWIRCSVKEAPDAVSKIIGIYANAIEVERTIPEEKMYSEMELEAGNIKKTLLPDSTIKKVDQPFSSFRGKPEEPDDKFFLRASERLRHKDRAITIWDYERLVLQAFPHIYKVKCLNHTLIGGSLSEGDLIYNEVAPGHVSVITIPNIENRNDTDLLKPYTKKSTLQQIEDYLQSKSSCQVQIHTAQPDFEEVKVAATITLRKEFPDINYYKKAIQEEVVRFLSPWAFTSDADVNFGGRIHQSVLIDFIEELPWVEFLTDFKLYHTKSNGEVNLVEEALASTGRSILVSEPASNHDLTVILPDLESTSAVECDDK